MKFWNRKNKIEFFHKEPSIIENFPIIESKDLKLEWVKNARKDFNNQHSQGEHNVPGFSHLTRCPGIFDLFKYGYIIPLHTDVIISTKDKNFKWATPAGRSLHRGLDKHLNHQMSPFDYQNFNIGNLSPQVSDKMRKPPWVADFIVKVDTGWHIIAPKGVRFLQLPIAYPDTFDFTSTIGILNPAVVSAVNFPMFWNSRVNKETLIKAGTPLGHLIPMSEKKYQMVQRIMNQHDHDWIEKTTSMRNSTFWTYSKRKKIFDLYTKHWKR